MCISPLKIGEGRFVACRGCWQCVRANQMHYAGRTYMEHLDGVMSLAVTLTYAGNPPQRLPRRDMQRFIDRTRYHWPYRFFYSGEFGELKGRPHWHLIMIFQDVNKLPRRAEKYKKLDGDFFAHEFQKEIWIAQNKAQRFKWHYWPHGATYMTLAHAHDMIYSAKYAAKEQGEDRYNMFSRNPPLGEAYLMRMAKKYAQQKLVPKDGFIYLPGFVDSNNKLIRVELRRGQKERFFEAWMLETERLEGKPIWENIAIGVNNPEAKKYMWERMERMELRNADEDLIKFAMERTVRHAKYG